MNELIFLRNKKYFFVSIVSSLIFSLNLVCILYAEGQSATHIAIGQFRASPNEQGFSTANDTTLKVYQNPNLRFSIKYPSDWEKVESLTFVSPDKENGEDLGIESVDVKTEPLPSAITLQQYTEAALKNLNDTLSSQTPNFTVSESGPITLTQGLPAYRIVYSYLADQTEIKLMQMWTLAGNTAYVVTYGAIADEFEEALPVVQKMIDSFTIDAINEKPL